MLDWKTLFSSQSFLIYAWKIDLSFFFLSFAMLLLHWMTKTMSSFPSFSAYRKKQLKATLATIQYINEQKDNFSPGVLKIGALSYLIRKILVIRSKKMTHF